MIIIKRNGSEATFDKHKIIKAIQNANGSVESKDRISDDNIFHIADLIETEVKNSTRIYNVEDIQDTVENNILKFKAFKLAKNYIKYRYQHQLNRESNQFDDTIKTIIDNTNSEIQEENANKNPTILSTQRDYIAGEVSKDFAKKYIFPRDIIDAHEAGIIHLHK